MLTPAADTDTVESQDAQANRRKVPDRVRRGKTRALVAEGGPPITEAAISRTGVVPDRGAGQRLVGSGCRDVPRRAAISRTGHRAGPTRSRRASASGANRNELATDGWRGARDGGGRGDAFVPGPRSV